MTDLHLRSLHFKKTGEKILPARGTMEQIEALFVHPLKLFLISCVTITDVLEQKGNVFWSSAEGACQIGNS